MISKTMFGSSSWSGKGFLRWKTQQPRSGLAPGLRPDCQHHSVSGIGGAMHSTYRKMPFSWWRRNRVHSTSGVSERLKVDMLEEFAG